jgi:hypothetical protein
VRTTPLLPRSLFFATALATSAAACQRSSSPVIASPDGGVVRAAADAGPPDPAAAIADKVGAVLGCLNKQMRARRDGGDAQLAGYGRTSFTDVFALHWMLAEPTHLDAAEPALCAAIAEDYRRRFIAATAERAKVTTTGTQLAPAAIELEPAFVKGARNQTAELMLEHEAFTREVLRELAGGRHHPVFDLVARAATQADVFRWHDLRYHAQTEPFAEGGRDAESAAGQVAFVALLTQHVGDFKRFANGHMYELAAGALGALCHMTEDLALHHGMTRRQLAGLEFFAGKPPSLASAATRAEARRWTREIITIARGVLDDAASWDRFLGWTPPAGFDPTPLYASLYKVDGTVGRLSYVDLARFYALQLPFHVTPALREELGNGPHGLLHWDNAALFEQLRVGLDGAGFVPRGQKLSSHR